jgi:hypothetical protein
MNANELRCDGLSVILAGLPHVMPPLNGATARKYWDRIKAMETGQEADPVGLTITLVAACLRRNYSGITEEWVGEHVDMDNWEGLSAAVFGHGAFRRWADAQAAQGNDHALQRFNLTAISGALSSLASPPSPAGASSTSAS